MTSTTLAPDEVTISLEQACRMALACWRLQQALPSLPEGQSVAVRYAVRSLAETLSSMGLEIIDLCGRAYDPGLAPDVVDVVHDEGAEHASALVAETVAPTIEFRGLVVRAGQVVVRYSSKAVETGEAVP